MYSSYDNLKDDKFYSKERCYNVVRWNPNLDMLQNMGEPLLLILKKHAIRLLENKKQQRRLPFFMEFIENKESVSEISKLMGRSKSYIEQAIKSIYQSLVEYELELNEGLLLKDLEPFLEPQAEILFQGRQADLERMRKDDEKLKAHYKRQNDEHDERVRISRLNGLISALQRRALACEVQTPYNVDLVKLEDFINHRLVVLEMPLINWQRIIPDNEAANILLESLRTKHLI